MSMFDTPQFEVERDIVFRQILVRLGEIWATVYSLRQPIRPIEHIVTGPGRSHDPIPEDGWKPFDMERRWGGFDQSTWFRMTTKITPEMAGQRVVALIRPHQGPHGNSLAYVNRVPWQGLDRNRDEILLAELAESGAKFEIILESVPSQEHDTHHVFEYADIAVMNQAPWDFYWEAKIALEVWEKLKEGEAEQRQLLDVINRAVKMVDLRHPGEDPYYKSLDKAHKQLQRELKQFHSHGRIRFLVSGNSHIDTAWMWPVRETRRKIGRTVATVLQLLDRYPEFMFSHSQPIQYEWLSEDYPELFERVKQRVAEGRWEAIGALYVEPDCNLSSGESLIRQMLYGIRYYQQEFGIRPRLAWVPDCFGFPWSMPQILVKSGIDHFFTTKISWGQYTKPPYEAFHWEGIDGSSIPTVMMLAYGSVGTVKDIVDHYDYFNQKDKFDEVPYTTGWGDGGGGPTAELCERITRLNDMPGLPPCKFGSIAAYYENLAKVARLDDLPVFNDELYLEFHRGCQTSQARTKRNNRKCEFLLRDTELLCSLALLEGAPYNAKAIEKAWKLVLLNQFHDILPGSSVTEVYDVADQEYEQVYKVGGALKDEAICHLGQRINTMGEGSPVVVHNTLSWVRTDVARVEIDVPSGAIEVVGSDGEAVPHQQAHDGALLFEASGVPPLGHAVYWVREGQTALRPPVSGVSVSASRLENDLVRVKLDKWGRFTSVYDKIHGREVLEKGVKANVLQLFDDRPYKSNAWDIDFNFEEIMWEPEAPEAVEVLESGPVRGVLRVVRRNEQSIITQDIIIYGHTARIDFETHVEWQEKQTLLKVAFPVAVRSPYAAFDIQYGVIDRTTHVNRDVDKAQFEVPAHKWADISEGDYGVSLLNDSRYGYDVKGNLLRLSLLRAPIKPDPHADEGEHDFTYAFYPHAGDWRHGTVQEGYELNAPLEARPTTASSGDVPPLSAFVSLDADNIIVDAVKKAEDSDGIIVRLYEAYGQRGDAELDFFRVPRQIDACNMVEEGFEEIEHTGTRLQLYFTPYEVKTIRVSF